MNKITYIASLSVLALSLTACGTTKEEQELATFSSSMSSFATAMKENDTKINEIDVTSDESAVEFLEIMDTMDAQFQALAEMPIPEQYSGIESLADEASENMTTAVSYFHSAYEGESFNESDADVAKQYYARAMTRLEYIGYVLVGEVPDSENVTVYEEEVDKEILDEILQDD